MKSNVTKSELQDQVHKLKEEVHRLNRTMRELTQSGFTRVDLPASSADFPLFGSPYVRDQDGICCWRDLVLQGLADIVRASGHSSPATSDSLLNLSDRGGAAIMVPRMVAEMLSHLIVTTGQYGRSCYNKGKEDGADFLRRMVSGEITADHFDQLIRDSVPKMHGPRVTEDRR